MCSIECHSSHTLNISPFASLLAASSLVMLLWNQSYASTGSALPFYKTNKAMSRMTANTIKAA